MEFKKSLHALQSQGHEIKRQDVRKFANLGCKDCLLAMVIGSPDEIGKLVENQYYIKWLKELCQWKELDSHLARIDSYTPNIFERAKSLSFLIWNDKALGMLLNLTPRISKGVAFKGFKFYFDLLMVAVKDSDTRRESVLLEILGAYYHPNIIKEVSVQKYTPLHKMVFNRFFSIEKNNDLEWMERHTLGDIMVSLYSGMIDDGIIDLFNKKRLPTGNTTIYYMDGDFIKTLVMDINVYRNTYM